MRQVISGDKCLGRIADRPPLKGADIVRFGKANYMVLEVDCSGKEVRIFVSRKAVSWAATPDHKLELKG